MGRAAPPLDPKAVRPRTKTGPSLFSPIPPSLPISVGRVYLTPDGATKYRSELLGFLQPRVMTSARDDVDLAIQLLCQLSENVSRAWVAIASDDRRTNWKYLTKSIKSSFRQLRSLPC